MYCEKACHAFLFERETGLIKETSRAPSVHLTGRPVSISMLFAKKEGYLFGYPSFFARARDGTRSTGSISQITYKPSKVKEERTCASCPFFSLDAV